jgi:molybdate transport system regulatory protein
VAREAAGNVLTEAKITERDERPVRLWLKLDLGERGQIGPGKIALLRRIGERGSIAAAARDLGMSYRRAWLLVDSMNRSLAEPVVATIMGGREHGGAQVTGAGRSLIAVYERICEKAEEATEAERARIADSMEPARARLSSGEGERP